MQAGKSYQLRLENQASSGTPNNIHTHGLHIPGDGNADDITRSVNPGECLFYNWTIPEDHMDGTFWYHAHVHGHTNDQVRGGAVGVLLIDPADSAEVPPGDIQSMIANERILLLATLLGTHKANGLDAGQLQFTLAPDTWTRLRVVCADPAGLVRDLRFDGTQCQVHPIAYDGVWRTQVPGDEQHVYDITGATRIDLAIKCSQGSSGIWYDLEINALTDGDRMVQLDVTGASTGPDVDLQLWEPVRPVYLQNLASLDAVEVQDTFTIALAGNNINGQPWDKDISLGSFDHGNLQEWTIQTSNRHPFHLHLYHMQVVTPGGCGNIYEHGQWYDVIASSDRDPCTVRFRLNDIGGRTIFHCHILAHEDNGVMGWVNVTGGPPHGEHHLEPQACDTECFAPTP